jgi:hypothetical protein
MSVEVVTYSLPTRDDQINESFYIPEFPELNIKYISYENKLCGSRYNSRMKCFWGGYLEITLLVNDKVITIDSRDRGQFTSNSVYNNSYRYMFRGISSEVNNQSRLETYLIFQVARVPSGWKGEISDDIWESSPDEVVYIIEDEY